MGRKCLARQCLNRLSKRRVCAASRHAAAGGVWGGRRIENGTARPARHVQQSQRPVGLVACLRMETRLPTAGIGGARLTVDGVDAFENLRGICRTAGTCVLCRSTCAVLWPARGTQICVCASWGEYSACVCSVRLRIKRNSETLPTPARAGIPVRPAGREAKIVGTKRVQPQPGEKERWRARAT